jgi:hypothetical protein
MGTLNTSSFSTITPGKVAVGVVSGVFVYVGTGGFTEVGTIVSPGNFGFAGVGTVVSPGNVDFVVGLVDVSAGAEGEAVGAIVLAHGPHPPVERPHTSTPKSVISDRVLS